MEILKDRYTITELSERLNVTDHALRYYEKEFGLCIPKDDRGRRYYTTELANIMYQIKTMRDDGLEIKAIKKILQDENVIVEPPPVVLDNSTVSIVPAAAQNSSQDLKQFFYEFKNELTSNVCAEVASTKEHFTREINKTKLELGACVENNLRRIESKMEKHFEEVDRSLSSWREKNQRGTIKRLIARILL